MRYRKTKRRRSFRSARRAKRRPMRRRIGYRL